MRIRSAQTLVFSRHGKEIVAFNFLTKSAFSCSHDLLTLLAFLEDWTEFDNVARFIPAMAEDELKNSLQSLIAVDAVTAEKSALAEAEEAFRESWKWGIPAALFHFSLQDRQHLTVRETEALQIAKLAECPQPALYVRHDRQCPRTLPLPPALDGNPLLQLMAKRRTVRTAAAVPITLEQLSDCLFAGLGIVGATSNCVGSLPLSMTPSGGARNPYEAYIYARQIDGLKPGFYHYSAFDHTLAAMDVGELPQPSELIGNREWADQMPCVIILCAWLERTMWKYDDANAYRVVLIEAGHIGQNLMLAATQHGLSACPTAALNHSAISRCIDGGNHVTHTPVYALTLAKPGAAEVPLMAAG